MHYTTCNTNINTHTHRNETYLIHTEFALQNYEANLTETFRDQKNHISMSN